MASPDSDVIEMASPDSDVIEEVVIEAPRKDDERQTLKAVPAWLISIVVHLVVLGLMSLIVAATGEIFEEPPIKTTTLPIMPQVEEKKLEREVKQTDMPLDVEVEADKPSPVSQLDVPVEEFTREEETDAAVPKGREEASADSEMGGEGAFMTIGAGGGSSGMFGSRTGGGKKRALGRFGGSKGSESAVDAALRWFKKHQSPDGSWAASTYFQNCTDIGPKCEPGKSWRNGVNEDVGLTGLALLCYLGAGYDHRMPSKYKTTVKKGIDWLLSVQEPDGTLKAKSFQYEHAIGTMALAEAYAMSNDQRLRDTTQKAVDVILARRGPITAHTKGKNTGWGDYIQSGVKSHTSASSWAIQALKSAKVGGFDTKDGLESSLIWLENCWRASCALRNIDPKKLDPYKDITPLAYYYDAEKDVADNLAADGANAFALSSIGALLGVFLSADALLTETQANYVMKYNLPTAWPIHQYYCYYGTLAIFQLGGERWEKWNHTLRDLLVKNQRTDGCFDGSWDWQDSKMAGQGDRRLLSTALCCLQLEVYYRYLPISMAQGTNKDHPATEKKKKK